MSPRSREEIKRYEALRYKPPVCSFCSKPNSDVRALVAGHNGVAICDECIEVCRQIVQEAGADHGGSSPGSSSDWISSTLGVSVHLTGVSGCQAHNAPKATRDELNQLLSSLPEESFDAAKQALQLFQTWPPPEKA